MILSAVIQEPSITLSAESDNFTVELLAQQVNPSIVLTPLAEATIPAAFEQRVADLENNKISINDIINGGIIF
jgi:hypothetical protein